jgi:hypothetical protein
MDDLNIDRLLDLAAMCETAIQDCANELTWLQAGLKDLDSQTCTGREWWRDRGHPTREEKLYILHSVGAACPVHGKPEPGGRLRVYVGNDFERIKEARQAIAREVQRQEMEARAQQIRHGLASCGYHFRAIFGLLGYKVGDTSGQPGE